MYQLTSPVVFLADIAPSRDTISLRTRHLEMVDTDYRREVTSTLRRLGFKLTTYTDLRGFLEDITNHKEATVLSLWAGQESRNRKALVPAICEAYGLSYVGADTYTQILCQDKALAKQFCTKFGFSTPRHRLVTSARDVRLVRHLELPLVVKPNHEGGSIGISNRNLVTTYQDAQVLVLELLEAFSQPILVEEFAEGQEVSIVLFGNSRVIHVSRAVEFRAQDPSQSWERGLYSYERKKREPPLRLNYRDITACLPPSLLQGCERLFYNLDKVELLRIDGRLRRDRFQVIELSPDVNLGSDCTVAAAFRYSGIPYEDMLAMILLNAAGKLPESESANS